MADQDPAAAQQPGTTGDGATEWLVLCPECTTALAADAGACPSADADAAAGGAGAASTATSPPPAALTTSKSPTENPGAGWGRWVAINVATGVAVPLVFTAGVWMMGFGSLGVIGGSFAAWWQSLLGGTIVRGSLFSVLQSIGAAGLSWASTLLLSAGGAATGAVAQAVGAARGAGDPAGARDVGADTAATTAAAPEAPQQPGLPAEGVPLPGRPRCSRCGREAPAAT